MGSKKPSAGYEVGYARTPESSRFPKGKSGNPRGRPPGRRNEAPYESVLGQLVTIREDGVERRVTAAEAFLLHMTKRGLEGDGAAARSAMAAIETHRDSGLAARITEVGMIVRVAVSPGSVNWALEPLRMARKLDRYRDTARMALEPWIVEAALARFGERQLTRDQQKKVVEATRTPSKVWWPEWWGTGA